MKSLPIKSLLLLSTSLLSANLMAATNSITPDDIMRFESLKKPILSDVGNILAVEVAPDRGDSYGLVNSLIANKQFSVQGGSKPKISHDGRFVAFVDAVPLLDSEQATKKAKKKLKPGLVLLDTTTGKEIRYKGVKSFEFNETGSHLAIWFEADESKKDDKSADKPENGHKELKVDDYDKGSLVELVSLNN
ncbi:S9 family peptidase, partial [Shewanella sp. 0m-11]